MRPQELWCLYLDGMILAVIALVSIFVPDFMGLWSLLLVLALQKPDYVKKGDSHE